MIYFIIYKIEIIVEKLMPNIVLENYRYILSKIAYLLIILKVYKVVQNSYQV